MTRQPAVAMLAAGSIGLLLTPLLTVSWYQDELLAWLRRHSEPGVSLVNLVTDTANYTTYGRLYCLVFPLAAVGFVGLSRRLRRASRLDRMATTGCAVGLSLCFFGCIADYWFKWTFIFQEARPTLHFFIGFGYALSLLLVLVASATYGAALAKPTSTLVGSSSLMIAAALAGVPLSVVHFPSGTMLVLNVAYVDIGRRLM